MNTHADGRADGRAFAAIYAPFRALHFPFGRTAKIAAHIAEAKVQTQGVDLEVPQDSVKIWVLSLGALPVQPRFRSCDNSPRGSHTFYLVATPFAASQLSS